MDPHYHNLSPNNSLLSHIFESLVGQDERQRLTPDLAESWKAIDATTWEFKLRKNVRFHDGTPFTADDVIFSFERAPNVEGSPSSFGIYARGKTFTKVDDHTVHIKTAAPYPLMPNDVSQVFIVSRKHGQGAKTPDYNSGKAAIGTGPYKFVEYTPGNRIVMQRNDQYWGDKPAWAARDLPRHQVRPVARRGAARGRRRPDRRGAGDRHGAAEEGSEAHDRADGLQPHHLPAPRPFPRRLAVRARRRTASRSRTRCATCACARRSRWRSTATRSSAA